VSFIVTYDSYRYNDNGQHHGYVQWSVEVGSAHAQSDTGC